ncbi:ChuX/HutX family heme-like substrate-binding protein [Kiritimatiellota bacterium B12222]|nr:ChuX/HutX family heme-like substrate-binding protein [Kiritimatiellota bacterium B12222]
MNNSLLQNPEQNVHRQTWISQPERFEGKRQIEIAEELGLSEGEWVDACHGHESQRLIDDPKAFISALPTLGEVMVLTRNPSAVHEKVGHFDHIEYFDKMAMAQVANHDIDLRIFLRHWHRIYAIKVTKNGHLQQSLQVFDREGQAVHKIFMREHTHEDAWHSLVTSMEHPLNTPFIAQACTQPSHVDPASIDVKSFRENWDIMKSTHEFFGLLHRFNINRIDALRIAGNKRAIAVNPNSLLALLEKAASREVPIMVFVANRGCIQIHTGRVHKIAQYGDWVNVLDENFNLHIRGEQVAEAWVIKKPTVDGIVTSLELYDADGNEIAMLFGERKPGIKELCSWRELVAEMPPLTEA